MATLKTRTKVVAEFKDAKMNQSEICTLLAAVTYDPHYNPFNHGSVTEFGMMLRSFFENRSWCVDFSYGYPSTVCKFGKTRGCFNCDLEYRYDLRTMLDYDRQVIRVVIKDFDDENDPLYYVAELKDEDFFDILDSMEYEGSDEEWDALEK